MNTHALALGITLGHFTKISRITLQDLKEADGRLELNCPLTHEYNSAYKEKCKKDASTFVGLANTYWSKYLYPINASDVVFDDGATCIDTFVSGREADDCYHFMGIKIDIRYRE